MMWSLNAEAPGDHSISGFPIKMKLEKANVAESEDHKNTRNFRGLWGNGFVEAITSLKGIYSEEAC